MDELFIFCRARKNTQDLTSETLFDFYSIFGSASSLEGELHGLGKLEAILEAEFHFEVGERQVGKQENVGSAEHKCYAEIEVRISWIGVHPKMIDGWSKNGRHQESRSNDEIMWHERCHSLPQRDECHEKRNIADAWIWSENCDKSDENRQEKFRAGFECVSQWEEIKDCGI